MITTKIANIISDRGISISRIAEVTGISSQILYNCFDSSKTRELRADELVLVCDFLGVNPLELKDNLINKKTE